MERRALLRWSLGAVGVVAASGGAAFVLARQLAGCYVAWAPLGDEPLCGPGVWGASWLPALLLLIGGSLLTVWGVAATRTAVRQFGAARRFRQRLLDAAVDHPLAVDATDRLGVPVVVAGVDVPIAVTVGAWRPRVVVSTGLLDRLGDDEVEAVLRHEHHHALQRHPLLYGLVRIVADALFVLPVVRRWADRMVVDAEVAADVAAIEGVGRRPLLSALDTVATTPGLPAATAAYGSLHGMLDERIEVLAGRQLPAAADRMSLRLSAAGALLIVAPVIGVAVAAPRAGWWSTDRSCDPASDPGCVEPAGAADDPPVVDGSGPAPPAPVDGMLPVTGLDGDRVGLVEEAAVDRVAREGGRAPVVDHAGTQVGWWTDDGFEPLDASD